jgi:hypothetical protein
MRRQFASKMWSVGLMKDFGLQVCRLGKKQKFEFESVCAVQDLNSSLSWTRCCSLQVVFLAQSVEVNAGGTKRTWMELVN